MLMKETDDRWSRRFFPRLQSLLLLILFSITNSVLSDGKTPCVTPYPLILLFMHSTLRSFTFRVPCHHFRLLYNRLKGLPYPLLLRALSFLSA